MEVHARAALAAREALRASHGLIRDARLEEQRRAVEGAESPAEATAAVLAARERWEPAVRAHDAAAEIHQAYVSALLTAEASGSIDDAVPALLPTLLELAEAWQALVAAGSALGLDLPELPAVVAGLVAKAREVM